MSDIMDLIRISEIMAEVSATSHEHCRMEHLRKLGTGQKIIASLIAKEPLQLPPAQPTMNALLAILGDAGVKHGGIMTWEQGLQALREQCVIIWKKP